MLTMSVIICAYTEERWDHLIAAVQSIRDQTRPADQLVIVIDHNEDLLARARQAFPDATVIANAAAVRGLSGARNSGLEAATGDLVGFLDDDARATSDWIAKMVDLHDADPRVEGAGGTVTPAWETRRPSWFPDEFDWVVGCTYRGMPTVPTDVRNLIGASMCFRRRTLIEAGGFRAELGRIGTRPLGCEETDLCIRVGRLRPGGRIVFDPRIRVEHFVPASRAHPRYFFSRCYAEGLSKAVLSRFVGQSEGLATERAYATSVLPAGILRGLRDGLHRRGAAGPVRAAMIAAGLLTTTAGYLAGRVAARR